MEHQTLVAYGALFTDNNYGFDDLLLHEVAHEWWGNKISVSDWADFWIQEGFATYAEALYVLDTLGEERYLDYMRRLEQRIDNGEPMVDGRDLTSAEAYTGDIYFKGAWVLHTLRWLIGDDDFFTVLWRFSNDPEYAYSLVSTADFTGLVAEVSGLELEWFWQRYVYTAEAPSWRMDRRPDGGGERVEIIWDDSAFELPLPIRVGSEDLRLDMPGGRGTILVETGTGVEVDPDGRVLSEPPKR
jgi:aminopeptidase N